MAILSVGLLLGYHIGVDVGRSAIPFTQHVSRWISHGTQWIYQIDNLYSSFQMLGNGGASLDSSWLPGSSRFSRPLTESQPQQFWSQPQATVQDQQYQIVPQPNGYGMHIGAMMGLAMARRVAHRLR